MITRTNESIAPYRLPENVQGCRIGVPKGNWRIGISRLQLVTDKNGMSSRDPKDWTVELHLRKRFQWLATAGGQESSRP